ncbi:MAG: methylmalonyl-CoA mutase family protein, partial [Fidelibacterota bacterium]
QYKSDRNDSAVQAALHKVRTQAESEENLIPGIIEAVKAKCTLGEIANVFREIFGEYHFG